MAKIFKFRRAQSGAPAVPDICVVGLGISGIQSAVAFASAGLVVLAVDQDAASVAAINGGRYHHVDPSLAQAMRSTAAEGLLSAASTPRAARSFIVTRGARDTPDGADDSWSKTGIETIAPLLSGGELICLETSGPLGQTNAAVDRLRLLRPELFPALGPLVDFAYVTERPEFGNALSAASQRRIIGGMTSSAGSRAASLFGRLSSVEPVEVDARTAEMAKLAESAYRDVNLAFANELAVVCDDLELNVWDLISAVNLSASINVLEPGSGVGGLGIASDSRAMIALSKRLRLCSVAREINAGKPEWVVQRVLDLAQAKAFRKIACLGLTAKPDTDYFLESPALQIALQLTQRFDGDVASSDPFQDTLADPLSLNLTDTASALLGADLVVFLVAHDRYRSLTIAPQTQVYDVCGVARAGQSRST